ncbi:hypothetical protein GCM10010215_00270 [Streptomyces virginiae]|uniref:Uncharacterized protein n=1 Tax=Streptomyces virginiae TaxID=1961 RepID=A0ABQ3NKD0_STRVG|nr:hypothetical protein GCM10010215_00270 [Streptomyces virginiae]GHI13236.1 hypothetical protein Scinn_26990 [Streptomyces virginiae]
MPTLISRKLKPQITERIANRTRQSRRPRRRLVVVVVAVVAAVVVAAGSVAGEEVERVGRGAAGALIPLTVLVSTS